MLMNHASGDFELKASSYLGVRSLGGQRELDCWTFGALSAASVPEGSWGVDLAVTLLAGEYQKKPED